MTITDKLIQKIFNGTQVSYSDVEKILFMLGYTLKIRGSHHGFRKPGFTPITIKKRTQLLPYQIKDIQEALLEHGYKRNK